MRGTRQFSHRKLRLVFLTQLAICQLPKRFGITMDDRMSLDRRKKDE